METRNISQAEFESLERRLEGNSLLRTLLYKDDNAGNGSAKVRIYANKEYTLILLWKGDEITFSAYSYTETPLSTAHHLSALLGR